jgi:hypothetical protein
MVKARATCLHRLPTQIFPRQQDRRHRAVGFRDDPQTVLAEALAGLLWIDGIRRENAVAFDDSEPVGFGIVGIDASPVAARVTGEKCQEVDRSAAGFHRARCGDDLPEREERGAHRATSAPSVLSAALGGMRTMRPFTGSAFSSTLRPSPWLCCHTDPMRVQKASLPSPVTA